MALKVYSRSLLTFAFVSQEFERTGDVIRGLLPLFEPVFAQMRGSIFSPVEFTNKVKEYYGMSMHPYVAEEWVPRFEEAGLLTLDSGDRYSRTYRCTGNSLCQTKNAFPVEALVDNLVEHTEDRLKTHGCVTTREKVEQGVLRRLIKPEFLAIFSKRETKPGFTKTLTLAGVPSSDPSLDEEALIDFILGSGLITSM